MQIIVFGANGRLGSRLIRFFLELNQQEIHLHAVLRKSAKKRPADHPQLTVHEIDSLESDQDLSPLVNGKDVVINITYITLSAPIVEAINQAEVKPKHYIQISSTGIFTKLPSPSAEKKRVMEKWFASTLKTNYTIIRPTMIIGHRDDSNLSDFMRFVRKYKVIPLIGDGSALIQPVYYKDLIQIIYLSMLNPAVYNQSINAGGEKALSNKELFKQVAKTLGVSAISISCPSWLALFAVKALRAIGVKRLSHEQILRFQEDKHVDVSALATLLPAFKHTPLQVALNELKKEI